jgi:SepF-like predicted cell division protein (DUF552 family)
MLPALVGFAAKALLPSEKKVDKDKFFEKKKASSIQKIDDEGAVVKQPTIQKKTISTNLLLPPAQIKALPPAAEVKKDVKTGRLNDIFDRVGETLQGIIDVLSNRNQTQKEEETNKKQQARVDEKKEKEEKLEKEAKKKPFKMPNIKAPEDKFNIMRFFGNVLLGSLALAIFNNLEQIMETLKNVFQTIKDFITKLGEFFSPIWNSLKWITGEGMNLVNKIKKFFGAGGKTEDEEYAEKAKEELKKTDDLWTTISKFFGFDSSDEESDMKIPDSTQPDETFPPISGGGSDFWTLVAVVSREDGDPQGRADVAQSIYNRLASGAYAGKTIRELILAKTQFQPTWDYPKKGKYGTPNPEWYNITDAKSAAKATGMSEGAMNSVANQLMDPTLQKNAAEFVGGRTDFTGYSKSQSERQGQVLRKSGDNYFGWDWNYRGTKVASVPKFNVSSQPSPQQKLQQRQQKADTTAQQAAQQAAAQTQAPPAPALPSPQQAAAPSLQPAAPAQAQVAPTQPAPAVSASVPQIMQQAEYEVPGGTPSSTIVPIPIGGGSSPMMMGGGGTRLLPVGVSKQALLNSYYQAQLTGFLYKQG